MSSNCPQIFFTSSAKVQLRLITVFYSAIFIFLGNLNRFHSVQNHRFMIIFIAAKHTKKIQLSVGDTSTKSISQVPLAAQVPLVQPQTRGRARCTMDSEQRSTATELKPVEFATFILMWGTHVRTGTTAVGQCQQCHPQGTDCHPLLPTVRQHPQC